LLVKRAYLKLLSATIFIQNCFEGKNWGKKEFRRLKQDQLKSTCFSDMPMILLVHKEVYFNTNNLDSFIPSVAISLL